MSAIEWKILGREKDGSLIASWISHNPGEDVEHHKTNIGIYQAKGKYFEVLHSFETRKNVIQASINTSKTLLIYVVKDEITTDNSETENDNIKYVYKPFLTVLNDANKLTIQLLEMERSKQIMMQFLWRKQSTFEKTNQDKFQFLLMIHEENILLFTTTLKKKLSEDAGSSCNTINFAEKESWYFDQDLLKNDVIVRSFTWCQWDSAIQALYYIHLKQTTRICLEKEEDEKLISPTLSAFQFHDDLPTETVVSAIEFPETFSVLKNSSLQLNIPLNLPKIPSSATKSDIYEDDNIPLRVHDSSLNLEIVSDESGILCVCHYYLYQPIKQVDEEQQSDRPFGEQNTQNEVHFAYSITILHHGCVIHCIIPGVPWEKAKLMKPTFTLHGDHGHMLVFQADLFMHLLDIGLTHEPCCHIVCPPFTKQPVTHLVPCFKSNSICFDSATLNLISINFPKSHLIETFKNSSLDNRLSIIHYFLAHYNDIDIFSELLNIIMEQPLNLDTVPLLKESLLAGTYSSLKKGLSQDALSLIKFLPLTTCNTSKPIQAKISNLSVGLSHETLYNTAMMLLSPQQRLTPYRQDIWTRLYERLNENNKDGKQRFTTDQVSEKLMYSLACYQPEALSRCSTPLSPTSTTTQLMIGQNFNDLTSITSSTSQRRNQNDVLPFIEFETCTASKQEHVISVNLRELSMHLVKHSVKQITGFRWLKDSYFDPTPAPTFVHAVSTRYVTAQLEISRLLCVFVCRASGVDARMESERGFTLM